METPRDCTPERESQTGLNPTQALMASEACYRRLFEAAQDGILIIDADTGYITDVNPFLVKMLGYGREDFIGKALWRFGPFKDIRASQSAYQDLIQNDYIRYEHLPLEAKDGHRVEVEFISNVYQVGSKRTIQCNIRDISQRKQADKSRRRDEFQISQAQKMAAIGALAGGVAHQFNNSLAVIIGLLSLLEANERPTEADAYLPPMKAAANKMSRLTRQLLAYARGGKYFVETIALHRLIRDSRPFFVSVLKPSITFETDIPSDLPAIRADRDQLQMALIAILENASEAIAKQGCIRVIGRKKVITEKTVQGFVGLVPGIYTSLTIEDNGKGMDEETRRRVFEPFFTTHTPGRGLVMAAVYGLVKNHDGWISIASKAGRGTAVCIYLPAADALAKSTRMASRRIAKTQQGSAF